MTFEKNRHAGNIPVRCPFVKREITAAVFETGSRRWFSATDVALWKTSHRKSETSPAFPPLIANDAVAVHRAAVANRGGISDHAAVVVDANRAVALHHAAIANLAAMIRPAGTPPAGTFSMMMAAAGGVGRDARVAGAPPVPDWIADADHTPAVSWVRGVPRLRRNPPASGLNPPWRPEQ